MTTSELTNFENKNQSQISDTLQNLSSSTEEKKIVYLQGN